MKEDTLVVKVKQPVAAEPAEVFAAFTHASALREWLCSVAEADGRIGGRIYLWWNSGYYASGEYTDLQPNEKLAFSWHGRGDPGNTEVKVIFKPQGNGTLVILTHSGMGKNKAWKAAAREFHSGWKKYLENLQSVLETGQDLRLVRRPLLGISGASQVDARLAKARGLAVKKGLLLDGVVPGFGAEKAGLKKDDVLLKLGGYKLLEGRDLGSALGNFSAGDEVKVIFYRGKEKQSLKVKLSSRPIPEIPASIDALAATLNEKYDALMAEMAACLDGASEEQAAYQPGGEWNARQNLAHLISAERDLHTWIASMAEGQEVADIFHGSTARLEAITAAFATYNDLLAEYRRNQIVTIMLLQRLPIDLEKRKGSFWRLAYNLLTLVEHTRGHIEQIGQGLQAAQQAFELPTEAAADEPAASAEEEEPPAKRRRSKKGKQKQEG